MKKSNLGFSLMEALIGISLFGGLTTAFVSYQISQHKVSQKEKLSANLSAFKARAMNTISNDASWLKTAELASDASQVKCIGSINGCSSLTSSYDMELYQADGSLLFSRTAVAGFQLNGTACASTANCPIQLELQWKPICSNPATSGDTNCKYPLIHITGNFVATDLPEVDVKKFNFSVMRSPSQISPCDSAPPSCGTQQALCTYTGWSCLPIKPTHCTGLVTWNDSSTGYGPCSNNVIAPGVLHDTSITLTNTLANRNGSASFSCVPGDPSINNTGFNLSSVTPNTCEPIIDGQCGLAHNTIQSAAPSTPADLCSAGIASTVTGANPWNWTCNGSGGGTNTSCVTTPPPTLTNGLCGAAHNTIQSAAPSAPADLCSAGIASTVTGTNPWNWACNGSNGGANASCVTTPPPPTLTNGQCGLAHNTIQSAAPSTPADLCSAGIASTVTGANPWNWTCNGSGGGTNTSCVTTPPPTLTNGLCGAAHNTIQSAAPSTPADLCSAGIASTVTGTNPWNWACNGSNGGANVNCFSNAPANPQSACVSAFQYNPCRNNTCQIDDFTCPSGTYLDQTGTGTGRPVFSNAQRTRVLSWTGSVASLCVSEPTCGTPPPPQYYVGPDACMHVGEPCTSTEALHDSGTTFIVDLCGCTFKNQMSSLFNRLTPRSRSNGNHSSPGTYAYTVKCIGGIIHATQMACANINNGVCNCP